LGFRKAKGNFCVFSFSLCSLWFNIWGLGMKIAGVHIERLILVIRDDKSDKVSCFKFETLDELFNSKEIKRCNKIFINAGENNFLVKTKFFPNKKPEQAKNYVLKHLNEFSVGRGKEYVIKIDAVPNENGATVYIIEGKEEQIYARIVDLPVGNLRITGVIPDNFAVSYPFMLEDGFDNSFLTVEIGTEELIINCIDKKVITFTRSAFFEKKDVLNSLEKEIEILLHRVGSVEKIYVTGKLTDKKLRDLKKEISSYKNKIHKFHGPENISLEAVLAYGLSLSTLVGYSNDLTPGYIVIERETWNRDTKLKKFTRIIAYFLGILLAVPLFLLIAGEVWFYMFDQEIGKLEDSYEKVKKVQTKVAGLREKLKLHEETRTPIAWGFFLSEISRIIPDNVCLIELESEPTISKNQKGFIFYLKGKGKTQEAVMQFYSEIQKIDIISETNIRKIKNEKGTTSYAFTVVVYSE
jgi:hypothetical protein